MQEAMFGGVSSPLCSHIVPSFSSLSSPSPLFPLSLSPCLLSTSSTLSLCKRLSKSELKDMKKKEKEKERLEKEAKKKEELRQKARKKNLASKPFKVISLTDSSALGGPNAFCTGSQRVEFCRVGVHCLQGVSAW